MPYSMSTISKLKSSHRFRRIAVASLAVFAGVLTLAATLVAPSVLLPLALLCWVVLFLGLYLSLRIRLGHVINTGANQHQQTTQLLELTSRRQERLAEDLQHMQLRVYRDLSHSLEAIRAESSVTRPLLSQIGGTATAAMSGIDQLSARLVEVLSSLDVIKAAGDASQRQIEVVRFQADGLRQQLEMVRQQGVIFAGHLESMNEKQMALADHAKVHSTQLNTLAASHSEQQAGTMEVLRGHSAQLAALAVAHTGKQAETMEVLRGHTAQLEALAVAHSGNQTETMGVLRQMDQHLEQGASDLQATVRDGNKEIVRSLADYKRVRKVTQEGMQWLKTEVVQEVESLLRLYRLGQDHDGAPLLGGWAMDPAGMLGTLKLIDEADPEIIIELGSGTSTVWIAEHLRQRGKGHLVSIDHLEEYASVTRQHLANRGLQDVAEVRLASLTDLELDGHAFRWYDPAVLDDIERIDFLLIDGPPTATGPLARYPAIPMLGARLRPGACVLLDDASRKDEKDAIALWLEQGNVLVPRSSLGGRVAAFISHGMRPVGVQGEGS